MSERHASLYLASRAVSAAVNAGAVAVYTHIASQALYGRYLIGFAICFVIYSLGVQWVTQAHFGNYEKQSSGRLAGSLLVIAAIATVICLGITAALVPLRMLPADLAWASGLLLVCFTTYFVATEIARTHLLVGPGTAATLVRSVASLLFGTAALYWLGTPAALLAGVGLGYAAGAVPVVMKLVKTIWIEGFVWPSRQELLRLIRYGWPLIVAFGASAAAVNVDRILLERFADVSAVAPYGATLDLMRQTFLVVAEAISVGYISHAKWFHTDGDLAGARSLLKRAFVTQCFLVVFGTAFFLLLGLPVLDVLLPESYMPVARQILPVLLMANGLLVLRAFYFGQVIYLGASSKLEFVSSLVMLAVTASAGLLLIPPQGAVGAALALALGQVAALLVYVVATPRRLRLPLDWQPAAVLGLAGAAVLVVGAGLDHGLAPLPALGLKTVLVGAASAWFLLRWNLFDARVIAERIGARVWGQLSEL